MTDRAAETAEVIGSPRSGGGDAPASLAEKRDEKREEQFKPRFESRDGKAKKLYLAPVPVIVADRCLWLTYSLGLDPMHPITGARWLGSRGPDGTVLLDRLGAPSIRFEPAKLINTPMRLVEQLTWQSVEGDGEVPAIKAEHCKQIAHVISQECDNHDKADAVDETRAILDAFLHDAEPITGKTLRGDTPQRYEAVVALQRPVDSTSRELSPPRYLVDHGETGEVTDDPEIAIRVRDLLEVSRRMVGTKPWAWLNGRMEEIGWERVRIDAHAETGRAGRKGPHARCEVYRGRR